MLHVSSKACTFCGIIKPLTIDEFGVKGTGFKSRCKLCEALKAKTLRHSRTRVGLCGCGGIPLQNRAKCQTCLDIESARRLQRRAQGLCVCGNPLPSSYLNCDECRASRADRTRSIRHETIRAYGGLCVCCGESLIDLLTIDHVNGGGSRHRREVGQGRKFYIWLKKQGYPKDGRFRVLCMSCNFAIGKYGNCPHQHKVNPKINYAPYSFLIR